MKLVSAVNACFLGLALVACNSAGSLAQVAHSADIASCKPLGEVVVENDAAKPASEDERLVALRQKAAREGATHVIAQGGEGTNGSTKGLMYNCGEDTRTTARESRTRY